MSLWIITSLYLVTGAAAGFLAGLLGIGGGIIIIPSLMFIFGIEGLSQEVIMHLALGTSLAVVACNAMISMRTHAKAQALNWTIAKFLILGMTIGCLIGPAISVRLSTPLLEILFGAFLGFTGIQFLIFEKKNVTPKPMTPKGLTISSVGIGILASMLGLGGGVFMIPLLTRQGIVMKEALALTATALIPAALIGVVGYGYRGYGQAGLPEGTLGFINLPVVAILVVMGFFFTPMGVRLARKLSQEKLKKIFGGFLCLVAIHMLHSGLTA